MGPCSKRNFFLTVSSLQLITTTERQVFDFLGFMWVPILVNFFHIIYVILGFFGAYQYRPKYIIVYCLWNILWLLWNIFLVCFYLNAAGLDKNSDLLNFGTGSFSWWLSNGPGCKAILNNSVPEHSDMFRPLRPSRVTGCLIEYEVIEIIHSSILSILALMGIIGGICLTRLFLEEDDSLHTKKKKKKQPRPLYSIEYSRPELPTQDDRVSPKPMTPRRVKRRSVISRDGTRRSSRRSSVRQSRRKNPSNRTMDQQENVYTNTTSSNLTSHNVNSLSQRTLNYDRISGVWDRDRNLNWPTESINMAISSPNLWNQEQTYANNGTFSNTNLSSPNWEGGIANSTRTLTNDWQINETNQNHWKGQSNPTFQQSSMQSLHAEDTDETYGNRPASARSSYSNYHGVRATPQVPSRTDIVRQSQRQFVLSGPPAYQDTVI